jgi:hypothetical protein
MQPWSRRPLLRGVERRGRQVDLQRSGDFAGPTVRGVRHHQRIDLLEVAQRGGVEDADAPDPSKPDSHARSLRLANTPVKMLY